MGSKTVSQNEIYPGSIFGFYDDNLNIFKTAYLSKNEFSNLLPILHERSLIKVRVNCENI